MDGVLKESRCQIESAEDFSFAERVENFVDARNGEFSHNSDFVQPFVIHGDTYVAVFLGDNHKG